MLNMPVEPRLMLINGYTNAFRALVKLDQIGCYVIGIVDRKLFRSLNGVHVVAMASTPALVISDLLCLRCTRLYKKVAARPLKSLLMDYYSPDVIALSKSQILEDVDALEGHESLKVTRKRRDSMSRSDLELDDIMSIITFADENN